MKLNFLKLKNMPIYEQLQLEEALLRADEENWCLLNYGTPPAIVLGVSAKPHLVVNQEIYLAKPVPVIRRFSGGGTVYVDENTVFVTFIFNHSSFPEQVLNWSKEFYQPVFSCLPFYLRENDYTIGEKKCGGNAQYFRKNRFLHHTSFLYDFEATNMSYLLYPPKTPQYRNGRSHLDFLTKLTDHFPNKDAMIEKISTQLQKSYQIELKTFEAAANVLSLDHRKITSLVKICDEVHDADHERNSCI